jgi:hypothetical protein
MDSELEREEPGDDVEVWLSALEHYPENPV